MDTWARATPEDRAALFNQTAVTKGISPRSSEKDFWVCLDAASGLPVS